MVRTHLIGKNDAGFTLVCHGGAGGRIRELSDQESTDFSDGLRDAYLAGETILRQGGSALDAVCASVASFEMNPLFNAGRGSALTLNGTVEMDASVMLGDGRAGAVAVSRRAKSTVALARHVMEATPHVLLVDPDDAVVSDAGIELMDPSWFVTEARRKQLERILADQEAPLKHGTVGCVALDREGRIAAATSTGGISKQLKGRVGDTPIVGAGTWAHDGVVGISCTGDGEAFIKGAVAHDVYARMAYGGQSIEEAATATFSTELDPRSSTGGLIAVTAAGEVFLCHNSDMMFASFSEGDHVEAWV